jgi:hypothetical protein
MLAPSSLGERPIAVVRPSSMIGMTGIGVPHEEEAHRS